MGILRWLAVALLAGALRPALARWTLSTGIIAPDAPISCNPYNFTDFNFNPQLSKGRFPPRTLDYTLVDPPASTLQSPLPFDQDASIVMTSECALVVDTPSGSAHPSLFAHCLSGFSDNVYVTFEEINLNQSRVESVFNLKLQTTVNAYLAGYVGSTRLLAPDRPGMGQLAAYAGRVVWSQLTADGADAYEIGAYDFYESRFISSSAFTPPSGTSYTSPTVCDDWTAIVAFDHATGLSSILLYEYDTDSIEVLSRGVPGRNALAARLAPFGRLWPLVHVTTADIRSGPTTTSSAYSSPGGKISSTTDAASTAGWGEAAVASADPARQGCRLVWVETAAPVKLVGGANVVPDTPTGGVTDGIVRVMELPQRRIRTPSTPAEWTVHAQPGPGFGKGLDEKETEIWRQAGTSTTALTYGLLMDVATSENEIFFLIADGTESVAPTR